MGFLLIEMPSEARNYMTGAELYERALDLIEASPDFELVGYALDGQEAQELARALRPHFVLVDRDGTVFLLRRTGADADLWAGEDDDWLPARGQQPPGAVDFPRTLLVCVAVGAAVWAFALFGVWSLF